MTAVFILTMLQRVFNGPLNEQWSHLPDLSTGERVIMAPAMALMFLAGVYPQFLIGIFNGTVVQMLAQLKF